MNPTAVYAINLPIYDAGDWHEGANCLGLDTDDFVTVSGHFRKAQVRETSTEAAAPLGVLAAVCARCPVQGWCLTDTLNNPDGPDRHAYRAGTTPKDRIRIDVAHAKPGDAADMAAKEAAAAEAINAAHDAGLAAARDIVLALLTDPPSTFGDIIDDEEVLAA